MRVNKVIGFVCAIDFFISAIYLIRSTYMILGLVTLTTLIVDIIFTKNFENIMANRIEFVSSVLIGTIFFVIRTMFFLYKKQLMISIMSIVVGFFIMSFYVTVRMIVFSKAKSVLKGKKMN